jgi:hypothetical protein
MAGLEFRVDKFDLFFDRKVVIDQLQRKERQVLSGTGAYGRRVMRSQFRAGTRRYTPQPGKPPRYWAHKNAGLRTVLFSYDPRKVDVVIGPVFYGSTEFVRQHKYGTEIIKPTLPVPQLLNEGGVVIRRVNYKSGATAWRDIPFTDKPLEKTAEKLRELIQRHGLL